MNKQGVDTTELTKEALNILIEASEKGGLLPLEFGTPRPNQTGNYQYGDDPLGVELYHAGFAEYYKAHWTLTRAGHLYASASKKLIRKKKGNMGIDLDEANAQLQREYHNIQQALRDTATKLVNANLYLGSAYEGLKCGATVIEAQRKYIGALLTERKATEDLSLAVKAAIDARGGIAEDFHKFNRMLEHITNLVMEEKE